MVKIATPLKKVMVPSSPITKKEHISVQEVDDTFGISPSFGVDEKPLRSPMSLLETPPKPKKKIEMIPLSPYPTDRYSIYRDGVTQGSLTHFLLCPEKFNLKMVQGLGRPGGGTGALAFGSLFHEVLDRIYTYIKDTHGEQTISLEALHVLVDTTLESLEENDRKILRDAIHTSPEQISDLEMNYGLCEVVLKAYFKRWYSDLKHYKWVELEQIFDVPYNVRERLGMDRPDIRIRGKFDGVMRIGNKSPQPLWLFETKTKGMIKEDFILSKLAYDLQVMLYLWAIKQTYNEIPQGVVYNIVRRPNLKQKQSENLVAFLERVRYEIEKTPDHYFMRMEYPHTPEELARWEKEFDNMIRSLIQWNDGDFHYKNPCSCNAGGWDCEYLPICGRNERRYYERREEIYPELRPGADAE